MAKYLGLDRIQNVFKIIKHFGGLKKSIKKLIRMDDLKSGELVGVDKYGNHYYCNPYYFLGRSRWIEYSDYLWLDYDASQVPAEWYSWLHYKTDLIPCNDRSRVSYKWMSDHSQNLTGTPNAYMPYSTQSAKIEAWNPKRS